MNAERITSYLLPAVIGFALVFGTCQKVFGAEPDKYKEVEKGFCEDIQLPCIRVLFHDMEFYAVFEDGNLVAITKKNQNGREEVIWGKLKLPLKKGEYEI